MRKLGGVILMLAGVLFVGLATLKGLGTLKVLLSTETSTYGTGFVVGSLVKSGTVYSFYLLKGYCIGSWNNFFHLMIFCNFFVECCFY